MRKVGKDVTTQWCTFGSQYLLKYEYTRTSPLQVYVKVVGNLGATAWKVITQKRRFFYFSKKNDPGWNA
jgi:hypothetical protein